MPNITTSPAPILALLCVILGLGEGPYAQAESSDTVLLKESTKKSFKEVIEELEFAISERNFRLTGRNAIGQEIRRRGHTGFPEVEVIHFCNVEYARQVLELDLAFITHMPCRIAVYEEGDHVVIAAILLPEDHADHRVNEFTRKINGILREIVDFVLERN